MVIQDSGSPDVEDPDGALGWRPAETVRSGLRIQLVTDLESVRLSILRGYKTNMSMMPVATIKTVTDRTVKRFSLSI